MVGMVEICMRDLAVNSQMEYRYTYRHTELAKRYRIGSLWG